MASKVLIASVLVLALAEMCWAGGYGGGHHKKVIIHVPYKVKTIHHTHTIYKHVPEPHKEEGPKVIGYSGDGDVSLGHGHEESGGEEEQGFTVGGDHGVWHSGGGGGGGDAGPSAQGGEDENASLEGAESNFGGWEGGSSGSSGGWESGASSGGGWEGGASNGWEGASLGSSDGSSEGSNGGGWEGAHGGWDLGNGGGAESYSGGSDSYGNVIGGGHGYDLTGDDGGHKGYD